MQLLSASTWVPRTAIGFLAGLLCWLPVFPARAQVGLSPIVIESELIQGRARGVLNVTNSGETSVRLRVYSEPFTYDADAGFTLLESDENDLSPYLQFSPAEVTIPPRSARTVRIIATIPSSQSQVEHRAVIFTETLDGDSKTANTVNIATRVGATLYVRDGSLQPALSAQSVGWNAAAERIQLRLSNQGDSTVRPSVEWQLQQGTEIIAAGRTNASTVIEGKERVVTLSYRDAVAHSSTEDTPAASVEDLPLGEYQLTGRLSWSSKGETEVQDFSLPLIVQ